MASQGIFPDADWTLQDPPATAPGCACHHYMESGQHNPFEHGLPSHRTADFDDVHETQRIIQQRNEEYAIGRREAPARRLEAERAFARQQEADRLECIKRWEAGKPERERKRLKEELEELGGKEFVEFVRAFEGESRRAVFTCGGEIPIILNPHRNDDGSLTPGTDAKVQVQRIMTRPVTIRWGEDGNGRTLRLPCQDGADAYALQSLVAKCAPATFGRGGEDIYDASYRKAGAMSPQDFIADFCPYEAGIIDTVAQLLLPAFTNGSGQSKTLMRGLRAELYKLNVYSAPSGLFKAHVDTPKSEVQVGSLVVCLPVSFEGGALAVRHQGHQILHDWSNQYPASIQWAAFYSDCEHEVLEVIAGHRLTLTYNLFLSTGTGLLGGRVNLKTNTLPLCNRLQSMLEDKAFMPNGGCLGIHLAHSYPHTNPGLCELVGNMLKGVDMAVYESIQTTASLSARLVPISDTGLPPYHTLDWINDNDRATGIDNQLERFEALKGEISDDPNENDVLTTSPSGSEDGYDDYHLSEKALEIRERKKANRKIVWVNKPGNHEMSIAYMAYGNQAEMKVKYTCAALLVKVPRWDVRTGQEVMVIDEDRSMG